MGRALMVWREPNAETEDYPGLVVHDGRVSGSITTGRSRLPLWAFVYTAVVDGWDEVERGWDPSEFGWTAESLAMFLSDVLEVRGEFARLICILADVERNDGLREEAAFAGKGGVVQVKLRDDDPPDAVEMPPPWWAQPEDRDRVRAQLQRCLDVLGEP
jgi:hypothetical protein